MILWMDGFDHYGVDETLMDQYGHVGSQWALTTSRSRTGAYCLGSGSTGGNGSINSAGVFRRPFPTPLLTAKIGYGFWVDSYPASETGFSGADAKIMASFIPGAGPEASITLTMGSDGSIGVWDFWAWDQGLGFTFGNNIGRSNPGVVHTSAWNHFETLVTFNATTGSVEVRIDGVTVVSLTNINSDHYGRGAARQILISNSRDGSGFYIDDLVASDDSGANSDFLGDMQVFTDFPNADAATQEWVPSTGAVAYAVVDDAAPDEDGTYAEADFAGNIMGLKFPALPTNLTEVAAVGYFHRTKKTGPGGSTIQEKVISNASSSLGNNIPVTTVYAGFLDIFETDPDTGAPWLRAAVAAAELDLVRTA